MSTDFGVKFPHSLAFKGYKSNEEYLYDNIKQIEMMIQEYLYILTKSNDTNISQDLLRKHKYIWEKNYLLSGFYISSRLDNTNMKNTFLSAHKIRQKFRLSDLEWTCILMSIMLEITPNSKDLFLKINGGNEKNILTFELIIKIFYCAPSISDIENYYDKIFDLKFKMYSIFFEKNSIRLDRNIFYFLLCGNTKISIKGTYVFAPDINVGGALPIREDIAQKISHLLKLEKENKQFCFYLYGENGIGKKTLVKRASELIVKNTVIIDLSIYMKFSTEQFYKNIYTSFREALIVDATICFDHFETLDNEKDKKDEYIEFILCTAPKFSREIFILSTTRNYMPNNNSYISIIDIHIDALNHEERNIMWNKYLKEIEKITQININEISNKFLFTPSQIKLTVEKAKSMWYWEGQRTLVGADICRYAYLQSINKMSDRGVLIKVKHTWDELIIDDNEKNMIRDACDQIKYKHIVYDKWGMNSKVLYGKGLSMLFAGPPGTGKTMAAQVVADELNLEVYKIDLSQVVSKYIGETEKNLGDIFNQAQKSNVILFFDETDALFGKRTQIKDSHDKNANIETSYILQKMEEYEGITIMTTNYIENIDTAFFRRISYIVHFAFPNQEERKKIWMSMFPEIMPIDSGIDFDYLCKKFELSGGSIKNIVVNSAFMAAKESTSVKMNHILKCIKYELKKQGKSIIRDDFGEYAYLIK